MTRRRSVLAAVAVVVLLATVLAVGAGRGDDGSGADGPGTDGPAAPPDVEARAVDEADPSFTIDQHDGPYRIEYRVDDLQGGGPASVERVIVDPPFRSRVEEGRPDGGPPSLQIATIDRLLVTGAGGQQVTVARVPGLAPAAVRLGPVVDAGLAAGVLERRGQRRVAGRRCQVFRTAAPLAAGPLRPLTGSEHVDSCVDRDGLLLEEVVVSGGSPVFSRTAFSVVVDPPVEDGLFATGEPSAPPDRGGGATTPADPSSAPEGPFFELPPDAVPAGFEHLGRFSVIPPQVERFQDAEQREGIIAGVADVHTRGPGLFVVYQGHTLGGVEAFEPVEFAEPVTSAVLGEGQRLLSALGSELRFARPDGRFVHVFGTLPPDTLLEVADGLVATEGTGLELLDG